MVWTDSFQAGFLAVGAIVLVGIGASKVGGLGEVWSIAREHGRINFFEYVIFRFHTVFSQALRSFKETRGAFH